MHTIARKVFTMLAIIRDLYVYTQKNAFIFHTLEFSDTSNYAHSVVNAYILHTQVFAPSKPPPPIAPSAVNEDLILEYVYGYRGRDTRANLGYLASGEAVYAAMGLAVVANLNMQPSKQRFFRQHSGGVCCVAVHPDGVHVARSVRISASLYLMHVLLYNVCMHDMNDTYLCFMICMLCLICTMRMLIIEIT
jgi:hypothetical protein